MLKTSYFCVKWKLENVFNYIMDLITIHFSDIMFSLC